MSLSFDRFASQFHVCCMSFFIYFFSLFFTEYCFSENHDIQFGIIIEWKVISLVDFIFNFPFASTKDSAQHDVYCSLLLFDNSIDVIQ